MASVHNSLLEKFHAKTRNLTSNFLAMMQPCYTWVKQHNDLNIYFSIIPFFIYSFVSGSYTARHSVMSCSAKELSWPHREIKSQLKGSSWIIVGRNLTENNKGQNSYTKHDLLINVYHGIILYQHKNPTAGQGIEFGPFWPESKETKRFEDSNTYGCIMILLFTNIKIFFCQRAGIVYRKLCVTSNFYLHWQYRIM